MAKYVPLRFNDAEEEVLQRLFAASSHTALGTHIKQVYFDASHPNTNALEGMRQELQALRDTLVRMRDAGGAGVDADLLLGLICGIYLMVRKSVGEGVRTQADQFIDVSAVEGCLRGNR
ncbi:hypothetical protein ACSFBX_30365 [Variovorax sp. RB2P76]|uniref:hypothetical protein n=1 Tax=Variovorax sp. RB2P76 TaxID=3443736 RepID=UPI003F46AA8B